MVAPAAPAGRAAAAHPLDAFMRPRSVALVGASDDAGRISGRPLRYLLAHGYAGALYPVNPRRATVQGRAAFASVALLPEVPDLAILALPAAQTPAALRDCAARGVPAALVLSAGFAEAGAAGAALQAELQAIARDSGLRLAGPNCVGLFNAADGLYATFSNIFDRILPQAGPIGIISQSGAFGAHLVYTGAARGIGVRYWATTGNEADLGVADWLGWMAAQPDIGTIILYLETVRDGDAFIAALRAAHAAGKPVVVLKAGRSTRGQQAAASHTAALAGSDAVFDAVFRQYGAWRVRTAEELIDVAYAAMPGILPRGPKLGLVTTSGGTGVQMCDAAEDAGLDVAPMPQAAAAELQTLLPFASVGNPVDVTGQILNDITLIGRNIAIMLDGGGYDAVVASLGTVAGAGALTEPLREAFRRGAAGHRDRLIAVNFKAPPEVERAYERDGFLVFEDAYRAVRAVGALCGIGAALRRPVAPHPAPLPPAACPLGGPLNEWDAKRLLSAAGVPILPERRAATPGEASAAAEAIGFPVAMKLLSPDVLHKTEIGGVRLGIADAAAARGTFSALREALHAAMPLARFDGVLVAPMAPRGVETIIGVTRDATFGPVVMLGLGGVFVEVLKDVTFRHAPFDAEEARRMIRELRGLPLLLGARGAPPADLDALAQALVAVSRFAVANAAAVHSIDINPFVIFPQGQGAAALDAAILPATPQEPPA